MAVTSWPDILHRLASPAVTRGMRSHHGPQHSKAVVGVAEIRRQRRTMRDRAPRVVVAPGAASRRSSRPRGRALRVLFRRMGIVLPVLPVEAPFVTYSGQAEQPERIGWGVGDERRAVERRSARMLVAPRVASPRESTAGGLFPFRL